MATTPRRTATSSSTRSPPSSASTRDELSAAGKAAANAAVDAAVEAGDLTEERAADIRERIENADGDGCGLIGAALGRGFAHGMGAGTARGFLGG